MATSWISGRSISTRMLSLRGTGPHPASKCRKQYISRLTARDGTKIGGELQWTRRGCTILRGGANILTTRFKGNAAYIDLATGGITSIWNIRAACSNNIFPANGVLNVPNLSGGCTCNYMPVSQAFVPRSVIPGAAGSAAGR